ncbi:MAG: hypothetical protein KJ956_09980 [Actinobacteria bacterium]|nr:hypothetical protein [Actinomycetota bacterium]
MTLSLILEEIEAAGGPLTPAELAARSGLYPMLVLGMLDALRANGRLAPEGDSGGPPAGCAARASCGGSCPGPGGCPLVIDLGLGGLTPR